jgi:hypothetical protein
MVGTKFIAGYFWAAVALLAAASGCTSHQAIEHARARGVAAGNQEGRRAGEVEGYRAIATAAREEGYQNTLNQLESVGEYRMPPIHTAMVLFGSLTCGFVAQWVGFYLPRRAGLLADIDWMILPPSLTQLNGPNQTEMQNLGPPTACILLLLALGTLSGCRNAEQTAWQGGYDEAYRSAFDEGWHSVADKAKQEGTSLGQAAAKAAATSGSDWMFYSPWALMFTTFGMFIGIFVQYMVMLNCRLSGGFPAFLTIALVPGMRHSLTYRLFEKKRQLMIAASDEIRALALAKNLRIAQLRAVQQVVVKQLKAISSLDEFSQANLMTLAKNEMDRIVAASEESITNRYRTFSCPHCAKQVGYTLAKAGTTVKCPHKRCQRSIALPPHSETNCGRK